MKALSYTKAHSLQDFSIQVAEVARPELRPHDVLIEVKAISTNPVDYKIRSSRSAEKSPVILGWDAAGVVVEVGPEAGNFKVGDEVFGAGDLMRDGSYAEFVAIDSRIIAKKPNSLSFADSAALPLTALTAWEALLESKDFGLDKKSTLLIVGGAGGVGSIAIQLLKAKTQARVVATASRPETIAWTKQMGADDVIDHSKDIAAELKRIGAGPIDVMFGTNHTERYLKTAFDILRPFGHLVLIDDPKTLDILPLKRKAISVHWELMFVKTLHNYKLESQGEILAEVSALVDAGKLKTTVNVHLQGFSADNILRAHTLAERGEAIGKIVITFSK